MRNSDDVVTSGLVVPETIQRLAVWDEGAEGFRWPQAPTTQRRLLVYQLRAQDASSAFPVALVSASRTSAGLDDAMRSVNESAGVAQ